MAHLSLIHIPAINDMHTTIEKSILSVKNDDCIAIADGSSVFTVIDTILILQSCNCKTAIIHLWVM